MEYARFVRQRTPAWMEFERLLGEVRAGRLGYAELDGLAFLYRRILQDSAVARDRFPRTGAARRLQQLALEGTHVLRVDASRPLPGPATFLTRTFPRAFRAHLGHILAIAVLFSTALILGFCLATLQPAIGLGLLGPEAIEGLKRGHLWTESLVSTIPPSVSSSAIATNNMSVALTGWAGGALAGLGAIYVALLNGFLLGAVVAVTWHYSMADQLLTFVSAHGPLEITLILVTAGTGLGMGEALVAAQDRPRSVALAEAGRRALVVLLGCLPWFLLLGVVEGFVSPVPHIPEALKLALGLALEGLFLTLAWNPSFKEEP